MLKSPAVRLLAAGLLLLFTSMASAQGTLKSVLDRRLVRVGMVPGLAPFVAVAGEAQAVARAARGLEPVRAADGREVAGFDVELAQAIAEALGARLEVTLVASLDVLLAGVRDGRFDFGAGAITRTLDRATTVAFSDPYFASGLLVLVRDVARFQTLEALRRPDVKVAFRDGTTAAVFARRELSEAALRPVASDAALYQAMDDARAADAIVIDYLSARDAEVRARVKARLHAVEDRRFTTEHFALVARQGDPDFIAWLNLFLREHKAQGAFHRLAARYNRWFRAER